MLKIFQARLQQYINQEFPDVQAGFRKGRGTRDQIANICWIMEKAGSSGKTSASLTMQKPLTLWITTNWKIFTCLLRNLYAGQNLTELDMKQQTSSKLRKEQDRILSSCLFNLYSEYIM